MTRALFVLLAGCTMATNHDIANVPVIQTGATMPADDDDIGNDPDLPTGKRELVPVNVNSYIDAPSIAILKAADNVEVFRIGTATRAQGQPGFGIHAMLSAGKVFGKDFAAKLASILLDDRLDDPFLRPGCFDPGVAFRVWHEQANITILACFKCDNFQVLDAKENPVASVGAFIEANAFRNRLLRLAKEGLPDDKDIQAVKELDERAWGSDK